MIVIAVFGWYEWFHVFTDNAQIQAHTLMLSSKVSGIVMEVLVQAQVFVLSFREIMFMIMMVFAFVPLYQLKLKEKTTKVVDSH